MQGKSYIIALYCIIRCILYPGTKIAVASGTRGQAAKIITEKVVSFYNDYPAIRFEIGDKRKNIKDGLNDTHVDFENGSKIMAVTSNDNSRGIRCNILIVDEFRMVKKEIVDKVLTPMLNVARQPGFSTRPEYQGRKLEANKEIYISSAWYKSHWIWDAFKKYTKNMIKGNRDYFVATLPYQLSVFHGLLDQRRVDNEKTSEGFDKAGFDMEYEALFVGENDKAYFKLKPLNKCRTLTRTFRPPTNEEFIENEALSKPKNLSNFPRGNHRDKDEYRLVALDVALMGGNKNVKNDTSAFTVMRLIRDGDHYRRQIVYLESVTKSISSQDLAVRLKQLYYDFEADYAVVDINGIGQGVFDACATVLEDKERGVEYPAWASLNDEAVNERSKANGLKCIYTVKANAKFNNDIAVALQASIQSGKLELPINDIEKREELQENKVYRRSSPEEQVRWLYPYVQTTALVNELVNLEYTVREGGIKIQEVGTTTKDRYSSLAYCNFYADELERDLKMEDSNIKDFFLF